MQQGGIGCMKQARMR